MSLKSILKQYVPTQRNMIKNIENKRNLVSRKQLIREIKLFTLLIIILFYNCRITKKMFL